MITSLLIAIAIVSVPIAGCLLMKQHLIRNVGQIIIVTPPPPPELKLNVYEDENCTVALAEIDWGTLEPPDSKNLIAYVKNLGDVPFNMTLSVQNWDPAEGATYMTLSWDYANQTVSVGEVVPVTFTLNVDEGISEGSFSFDIVITAEEV